CKRLEIVLIALYPNSTHILQPCDVAAFRPLKASWNKSLLAWRRAHPTEALTKLHIGPILKTALQKDMTVTIQNGFRATGLFPFNPDAVNYSKWKGHQRQTNATDVSSATPKKAITLEDFRQIVGEEAMTVVEKNADDTTECPAELALCRLYRALSNPEESTQDVTRKEDGPSSLPDDVTLDVDISIVREEPISETEDPDDPEPRPHSSSSGSSDLQGVLQWPHSPKRKGKRQTEKMPYVITSKRWKDLQDEKDRKRNEEARLKAERAELRLAKRAEKDAVMAEKAAERQRKSSQAPGTRKTRQSR
ncbi:uncharacterized protein LOC127750503, partial [Frankliniella occidentalis]|uniref:Uncharacterized protein LOC127750503 n=1 Tax=Frankliniella occidentalis TaxID=133901 RepID=A0A9C6X352_FRAOC